MITAKKQRFVLEYLVDLNATKAAERTGYSARTAYSAGQRLLKDVEIAALIAQEQDARAQRVQVRADEVLRELIAIVKTNPSHFTVDAEGNLALRDANDTESWRAVASVKQKTRLIPQKDKDDIIEREVEYKLWDKNSAIEKAMKHLGLLEERVRHTVGEGQRFSFMIDSPVADSDN